MTIVNRTVLALCCALLPSVASAQSAGWYVAPQTGMAGSSETGDSGATVGVSGGWRSAGRLAVEGEVTYAPTFFEQDGFRIERAVATAMGNIVVDLMPGDRRWRPFVIGGAGLLHPRVREAGSFSTPDAGQFGLQVGAGVAKDTSERVGFRGDVRYVRAMDDDDATAVRGEASSLRYVRASAALVVGF